MKPPPFAYHAPATVEEAVQLLAGGNGTYALAGGQSLVPLMKFRRVKPTRARRHQRRRRPRRRSRSATASSSSARSCASRRCSRTRSSRASLAAAARGARYVGYSETRHRGTVGGSLAYAAPWAELTAVAVALDATIEVRSRARRAARSPRAIVLPRPERDRARAGRADRPRALPRPARRGRRRLPRGQRPLPRLRAGRRRGGRHARRGGSAAGELVLLRVAPTPVCRRRRRRARLERRRSARRRCSRRGSSRRTTSRSPARTGAGSPASSRAERCATPPTRARRRDGRSDRHAAAPRRGQRPLVRGAGRAAPDARRLPARRPRPDGHASRLRARLLRQLQRPARRRGRALVPHVRGAGRRAARSRPSRVAGRAATAR